MNEWWDGLQTAEQVYYMIAIASTTVVLLQMVLMLLGFSQDIDTAEGGMDVDGIDGIDGVDATDLDASDIDVDADVDDADGGGLKLLSIRTVTAFFVGFGWTGAVAMDKGAPLFNSIVYSLGGGTIFMLAVYYIMTFFLNLRYSGSLNYKSAIGKPGTVYMAIPPEGSGTGKIQVKLQGRLKTVDAVSRENQKLESQSRVKVIDLQDENTVVVESM